MSRHLGTALAVVLLATALASVARAEIPGRGFTLELGLGVNGVTSDDYVDDAFGIDLDPLVGLSVAGLYRPMRYLSAGLLVHYGFLYASSDRFEGERSGLLAVAAEARGHYPLGRFEPWAAFGLGFGLAHTNGEGDWGWLGEARGSMMLLGAVVEIAAGVSIYVTDDFALGPFFRMIFGIWPTACYDLEGTVLGSRLHRDECDEVRDIYSDEPDDLPHLWIVGISLTNTF